MANSVGNRTVDWGVILNNQRSTKVLNGWATGQLNTNIVRSSLRGSQAGSEFNFALRKYGVMYGRRVARKALRRRGVNV